MKQIFESLLDSWQTMDAVMLISIIDHAGSTPRGVGAQMLVGKNGLICGTIGGGAIEKKAIDRAVTALATNESFIEKFELTLAGKTIQMACGGSLILHFLCLEKAKFENDINTIVSKINEEENGFIVIDTNRNTISYSEEYVSAQGVYSFVLPVPQRVVIFGGGHVARALVPVLSNIGFSCIVMENRREFVEKSNFPNACDVVECNYNRIDDHISIRKSDYVVVMTHGHTHDYIVLEQLLRKDVTYVGVMGSRRKKATVNAKLIGAGISEDKINTVHSPIGLSIGAITPEEIAISIAAELIQVRAITRGASGEKVCPSKL